MNNTYEDSEISEINMIPFVDIILVVLVIFMATATFVAQGKIPIALPQASAQKEAKELEKPLVITLNKEGYIFFNDEPVSKQSLNDKLAKNKEQISKNGITLRSDAKTSFEYVVQVIDLCKQNNISKFSIQTQEKM